MATPPEPSFWKRLSWDTDFFGLPIASITRPLSKEELSRYFAWQRQESIQCTYYLCPIDQTNLINTAIKKGFEFIDLRVTLVCQHPTLVEKGTTTPIRSARATDLPELGRMVSELHTDTRFFTDTRFNRAKCKELYARWIENDVRMPEGTVLIYPDKDDRPVGYLSCNTRLGKTGQIGLFGVDLSSQGQGVGSALLAAGLRWFVEKGCASISVVTQGKNQGALRKYQSLGFQVRTLEAWLHHWSV
jgi:ribosomal protein S18 acetylase RimI-like enzyme